VRLTDEYIHRQSKQNQAILLHLIAVFEKEIPELDMRFKWGMPYFYYRRKPFCYFAVNAKRDFVDAGFAKGFQLIRNQEVLVSENRNTVKSLRYFSLNSVDNAILEDVICEARGLYQ
jgi:hypothetical protein